MLLSTEYEFSAELDFLIISMMEERGDTSLQYPNTVPGFGLFEDYNTTQFSNYNPTP